MLRKIQLHLIRKNVHIDYLYLEWNTADAMKVVIALNRCRSKGVFNLLHIHLCGYEPRERDLNKIHGEFDVSS